MNKETEKVILESLRMLLWENWRKWDKISRNSFSNGECIETNEIIELVGKINKLIEPKDTEPTLPEKTKDALNVSSEVKDE